MKTPAEFARSIAPLLESDDPEIWLAGVSLLEQREAEARNAALREAAEVAEASLEQKHVRWEYATNVSTVPRDAILALIEKEEP